MNEKDQVLEVLYAALEELNEQLPEEHRLEKSKNTVLFGEAGKLDSLGLVNLIVLVEQKIEETFGRPVTLADERAMSERNSPFRTVDTFADYICRLRDGDAHG